MRFGMVDWWWLATVKSGQGSCRESEVSREGFQTCRKEFKFFAHHRYKKKQSALNNLIGYFCSGQNEIKFLSLVRTILVFYSFKDFCSKNSLFSISVIFFKKLRWLGEIWISKFNIRQKFLNKKLLKVLLHITLWLGEDFRCQRKFIVTNNSCQSNNL